MLNVDDHKTLTGKKNEQHRETSKIKNKKT